MRPTTQIVQMTYQNPDATAPLYVPVAVVCNTSDEDLERNIKVNAARELEWIALSEPHDGIAVMVGGGPSLEETIGDISEIVSRGGVVFAMNAASSYLRNRGVEVDYQVIADAKQETSQLVDIDARCHLFASQVHVDTIEAVDNPTVWHLEIGEIERLFPDERVAMGGYTLIGGGASVGNSALCLAYAMGYRNIHVFGYDSCHRDAQSHAYDQPMNMFIPCVEVEWAGKKYLSSVAMKAQAEKFQITAQALKQAGCELTVHGDGLLPAMYNTHVSDLTERDKYRLMWQFDGYREYSPGETVVGEFLELVKPDSLIVDFGCGTGRGSVEIARAGHSVFLVDFADNCRDQEALGLPFLEWDLTVPCPISSKYGFCTDVMEHIPTDMVKTVVSNIMASSETVFFQISTVVDAFGDVIGTRLHHTVKDHAWWANIFVSLGNEIVWQADRETASCFVVKRDLSERA